MAKEKKHLGSEIFIAGYDGDQEVGELFMCDSLSDLNDHLSIMNPISEANLTVVHGILTSAEYIPEDIGRGVYVIVVDPNDDGSGCIFEFTSANPDGLAELIEENLSEPHCELSSGLTIDNIFILYGYEANMCYAVSEDEVDEGVIETSQKIADAANEMEEKILGIEG